MHIVATGRHSPANFCSISCTARRERMQYPAPKQQRACFTSDLEQSLFHSPDTGSFFRASAADNASVTDARVSSPTTAPASSITSAMDSPASSMTCRQHCTAQHLHASKFI